MIQRNASLRRNSSCILGNQQSLQEILMALCSLFIVIVVPENFLNSIECVFIGKSLMVAFSRYVTFFQLCFSKVEEVMEDTAPYTNRDPEAFPAQVSQTIYVIRLLFKRPGTGNH